MASSRLRDESHECLSVNLRAEEHVVRGYKWRSHLLNPGDIDELGRLPSPCSRVPRQCGAQR